MIEIEDGGNREPQADSPVVFAEKMDFRPFQCSHKTLVESDSTVSVSIGLEHVSTMKRLRASVFEELLGECGSIGNMVVDRDHYR